MPRKYPPPDPKPQGYRRRKLTPQQVREIRAAPMDQEREVYELAAKYNVSRTTIWRVRARTIYKDV